MEKLSDEVEPTSCEVAPKSETASAKLNEADGPARSLREEGGGGQSKSKRSKNKAQKLLQPLGNLVKAHKTRVCKNMWNYNGGYISESCYFSFLIQKSPPHTHTVLFARTWHINEELAAYCCSTVVPAALVALSIRCRYLMSQTHKKLHFRITETLMRK